MAGREDANPPRDRIAPRDGISEAAIAFWNKQFDISLRWCHRMGEPITGIPKGDLTHALF